MRALLCPLWVKSGHFSYPSVMSALGGKADVNYCVGECPLLAISGHSLVRRVLLGVLGPDGLGSGFHLPPLAPK